MCDMGHSQGRVTRVQSLFMAGGGEMGEGIKFEHGWGKISVHTCMGFERRDSQGGAQFLDFHRPLL